MAQPRAIKLHDADNVAIVANAGGLPAGSIFADGIELRDRVPMGHKFALADIPAGAAIRRYGAVIGHARADIPRGAWVAEKLVIMPEAPDLAALTKGTPPAALPPLEGYSFEGFRNPDGSVGTRNVLAVSTSVQCVAGTLEFALQRVRSELLPRYPNVSGVVGLTHTYGC